MHLEQKAFNIALMLLKEHKARNADFDLIIAAYQFAIIFLREGMTDEQKKVVDSRWAELISAAYQHDGRPTRQ